MSLSIPRTCVVLHNVDNHYNELDFQEREIRVVVLLPGQWSEPIRCVLTVVRLGKAPSYQALSYVWGDPRNQQKVSVNQQPFLITRNLHKALRRLRDPDAVRMIWVDALCINQEDVIERNQQVRLMSDIYKSASEVLIWLGDAEHPAEAPPVVWYSDARDTEMVEIYFRNFGKDEGDNQILPSPISVRRKIFAAFVFLSMTASDTHLHDLPFFKIAENENCSISDTVHWRLLIEGLQRLINVPWWNRIWTLQEAVLSTDALIHFGNLILPWKVVTQSCENFGRHCHTCCQRYIGILPFAEENTLINFRNVVGEVDMLREGRDRGTRTSLSQLLRATSSRTATDERDKVYALLSLVTHWYGREPINPDYAAATTAVYARAVMSEIQGSRSLQILQGISMEGFLGLPSWVTRANSNIMPIMQKLRIGISDLFDAAKGMLCDVQSLQESTISVLGHSYGDIVADVSNHGSGETRQTCTADHLETALKGWQALADVDAAPNRPYPSGGTWEENFWRAIANDAIVDDATELETPETMGKIYSTNWRRLRLSDKQVYKAWWLRDLAAILFNGPDGTPLPDQETTAHVPEREVSIYYQAMEIITLRRSFFVTEKGFMGTGPLTTLPGDRITVLFGGNVPFLLREPFCIDKSDEASAGMRPYWELIGDCYVHRIMDGEAMDTGEGQTRYILRWKDNDSERSRVYQSHIRKQ